MSRVLYVSYDGMLEPLGQSQVLSYLQRLAEDHEISLISFEKAGDLARTAELEALRKSIRKSGIRWTPLHYHKEPSALATAYDILQGIATGVVIILRRRVQIVHARSYVASVMALALKRIFRIRYIFDMRGFWADERLDGGIWSADCRLYRVAKWFEKKFLLNADVVVSLTHTAVDDMRSFPYLAARRQKFAVITTCANLQFFHPRSTALVRAAGDFVLGYVGTVGTWYLFDEALRTFNALLKIKPRARLLIINRNEHDLIRERMLSLGVAASRVELKYVPHQEVVGEMQRMDACVFYIKPAFSKRASAPTKFGELLGCGIPCISNSGVGDTESILEGNHVGVVLRTFDEEAHAQGVLALIALTADADIKSRCVGVANRYFALDQGIKAYDQIYREL